MKNRQISATEFKAKCLGLLDEVNAGGGTVTITKRGKPVAVLHPATAQKRKTTRGMFKGKIIIPDDIDIVNMTFADLWEAARDRHPVKAKAAQKLETKAGQKRRRKAS